MSRRKSRIVAFQGLYSWDVGGMDQKDVLELSWARKEDDTEKLDEESGAFARMLIAGTIENCAPVDELIKSHLKNWDFERINKVTLAILRLSIYCLVYTKDVDASIVIDEAVDIAKNYGPDDSYKFVNAILDNIRKENNN
ncbi:MAG: transcription antitermination factor NusB [Treponema sp.]|nr:transcription antitermination factor NusB [Candidatus Treponema equifaecale]